MTYIEFFDKNASENIAACLTCAPDRVVYIGDNSKLMKRHIAYYKRVFSDRGYDIEFLYKTISKGNFDRVVAFLDELVQTYDDCVFDITGGEEMLILALGAVCAKHLDKNIQVHKLNLRNNAVYDCDKDGITVYKETPTLSVEEQVRIYGGEIIYGGITEDKTYRWELTPDFADDIQRIWSVCRGNVRLWNMQIGVLAAAETVGTVSEDGLTTTARISAIDGQLSRQKASYKIVKGVISALCKAGVVTFLDDGDEMTISYKNEQVKKCLTKAGQALEMKVYLTAKSLFDDDGVPVYDDVMNGVVIDWDGEPHDEEAEGIYDTENEIDILMMHDIVPVFVSCKNGVVTSDELYKLNSVAERFGGQYSKKVLVATSIAAMGEAGNYLRQRAKDMNIRLVENVQELDDVQLARKLKSLWSN